MPFVIVAILALVGNSIEEKVLSGEILFAKIDTIIWLFGITLLLLMSPVIAFGLIRGDGIHSFGSKMGSMVVASGMKAMSFYPLLASGISRASNGLGRLSSKALLEPSIKELLQGENPNLGMMRKMNKKGGFKNPLKSHRPLEERLQELGLTKSDAIKMTKLSSQSSNQNKKGNRTQRNQSTRQETPNREKNSFQFDPKYWNSISPEHREGIKRKYGITGNEPSPDHIHYPVNSGRHNKRTPHASMTNQMPTKRVQDNNKVKNINNRNGVNNEL
ncbi:MAG: hypothetical protein COW78_02875 [Bdellovibrio sp. CG22_combo_CG10-13_8_21_14_all_39_27]|nr:MAG: hypothetical protein COW78_02875 [Bdellovibrio sp. CG22_combo_CG10-13_8_21_14_all_39_27]